MEAHAAPEPGKTLSEWLEAPDLNGFWEKVQVAEEVLERRGLTMAARGGVSLFMRMAPTPVMVDARSAELMRLHCEELCDRFEGGQPFAPATAAEVICGLHGASLKAPLNSDALAVLKHLTTGTFLEACLADLTLRERWPGQVQETLADLRHKLRTEARK